MFTFLKNRFISSTIAVIGAAEGAKEKLGLQQQNSKRTSTTSDHPFNNNNYFSLPRSTPYQSAGPNLMDEEYFLRKFDEYEKNDTWEYVFQVYSYTFKKKRDQLILYTPMNFNL
jgi:hypothetical protein